jgi:hypothetical protein
MLMQMLREAFMPEQKGNTDNDTIPVTEETRRFKPITTQEELDRIVGRRVTNLKSRYSDYDDIKGRATSAEARATDAEERLSKAEAKLSEIEAVRVRANTIEELAACFDIPVGILETISDDELEGYAETIAPILHKHRKKAALPVVVSEGSYIPDVSMTQDPLRELLLELR